MYIYIYIYIYIYMMVVWSQVFKAKCKCLSIIMLDSVIEAKEKYYPQTLLEECKYKQKRIKMENLIDDNLEKSESDESDTETDSDNDNNESKE